MGRKNNIEGQMSLFDLTFMTNEYPSEKTRTVNEPQMTGETGGISSLKQAKEVNAGEFAECDSCWCATCEHSTLGGGVPRPFGESTRPCPSCELCVSEGKADVCIIGSAEEGCRYRAEKEGLIE